MGEAKVSPAIGRDRWEKPDGVRTHSQLGGCRWKKPCKIYSYRHIEYGYYHAWWHGI